MSISLGLDRRPGMEATFATTLTSTAADSSARRRWTGRVLTTLFALFMTFDAAIKLTGHPAVAEASASLGLPADLAPFLGLLLAGCLVLHLVPRTAVLGAVLLTGYLGGAVLAHLRVGNPLASHTLFPIYVGLLMWGGAYLRDARVRGMFRAR